MFIDIKIIQYKYLSRDFGALLISCMKIILCFDKTLTETFPETYLIPETYLNLALLNYGMKFYVLLLILSASLRLCVR
jgi:hypothetical protein